MTEPTSSARQRGSLLELETQILIAQKLAYVSDKRAEVLLKLAAELGRMLNSLIHSIRPIVTPTRPAA